MCYCTILSGNDGQIAFVWDVPQQIPIYIFYLQSDRYSYFRGVFAAAHDLKTEWVVVKGIKDYADGSRSPSTEWGSFASVMAASVVANILSDAVIFEDWPHYNPGNAFPPIHALL